MSDRINAVLAGFGGELAEVAERLRASTVQVSASRSGGGSGVIWDPNGLIVTNAHVVGRAKKTRVELADGRHFEARVTAADPRRDVASLTVDACDLPAAAVRDSATLRVGELALAAGNPLGLVGAITAGVIHAAGAGQGSQWIQADVRIAPGNSGGPLADALGRVVGINSMICGGLAVAVSSAAINSFLRVGDSSVRLGVTTAPIGVRLREDRQTLGLMIYEIEAGSSAEAGGALPGDVIIGIAGKPIGHPEAVRDAVLQAGPKGLVALDILRAGSTATHTFHLGSKAEGAAAA